MSARPTLAVIARADASSPALAELLRIVAALVAADQPVRLVCVGEGCGALAAEDLTDEAASYLEGVADFGVVPQELEVSALFEALAGARDVLRVASAARRAEPALLVIDDAWLAAARADPAVHLDSLIHAGQILRA